MRAFPPALHATTLERRPPGVDRDRVADLVRELLIAVGEDPDREGLRRTPERVADNWVELLSGTQQDAASALDAAIAVGDPAGDVPAACGMVLLRDIRFRSVCEHHLLPFAGRAHIAYLPGDAVVGFGALVRVVDILAARAQVQERLGEEIASTIVGALAPRGVLVVLDAVHQCVTMRSSLQTRSSTLTIAARGGCAEPAARAEIISLIGGSLDAH
ncbi:GTP cyclohydrolase I [Microbacterium trichothecenolyticum]|uniref:GTP cyclohydrolase 1 n=1 Tax=Microbacterium ureisolvens TaxID=2781186 RepID=A0ABS7I617_9MICO|nr:MULTISPECIES: GTP cyclohydrolase I [Microbacterium]MBW9111433.1 GTP cyclohydrolase I [Microbacterium ureisolvens]MBW9121681.1 GTP cyclohydrolase I [Microbacterium trichothecenolyticum]